MRLIKPSYKIESKFNRQTILRQLELFGRVCYKSEERITADSAARFVKMIVEKGHTSIFDHVSVSVRFISNRGFTHELVRHRLAAYSQESTRYCNYSKDKFRGHTTFIIPPFLEIEPGIYCEDDWHLWEHTNERHWMEHMILCEKAYNGAIARNWKPQEARGLLPIDLKTEIIITANLTEWLHIFKLRTSAAAHPQMRELMIPLLRDKFQKTLPEIFKGTL